MQPAPNKDPHAAALGQRGGQIRAERLDAQKRSAISRHAAWSRWHPREAQAARAQAQEQAYLIQQILNYPSSDIGLYSFSILRIQLRTFYEPGIGDRQPGLLAL